MEQKIISQMEFVELCRSGEKTFSNAVMQFLDISDFRFTGITIRNSKLLFCTFRNCDFIGVKFENCEIYWGSFYNGRISQTCLDNCELELTLFESIQFDGTKMHKCNMRYCGILNSNAASVDTSTSSQYRLITDVSQLSRQEIETLISETVSSIARLDVGLRMKIKEMIRADMERYKLALPEERSGEYSKNKAEEAAVTYGEVKHMVMSSFGAYSQKAPYKTRKPYETTGAYKAK